MNRILFSFAVLIISLMAKVASAQRQEREVHGVNSKIARVAGLEHKVLASKSLGHHVGYVVWTPADDDNSDDR